MTQDRNRSGKSADGKNNSTSFSFLLYALIFGAAITAVLMYFARITTDELSFDDLVRLAENSKFVDKHGELQEGYDGTLIVIGEVVPHFLDR